MSRQEKGSRIRMLPARLQLQQRDAHTGSYPTVSRFSTDGRTGTYNTSFNDTKTVVFASSDNYMPGVGLSSESNWLDDDKSFDTVSTFSQEDVITLKIDTGKEAFAFAYAGKEPAVWHDTKFNILLKSVNGDATEWATVVSIYAEPDVLYVKLESDIVTDYSNGSKLYLSPHILPTTGNIRSQVIDGLPFMHFTPGQELTPFRDNNQPAADGKSSNNPFFATGSADLLVGGGFSSPLWSKNKIEIDISVNTDSSLKVNFMSTNAVDPGSDSYLMGYYNFSNKTWQGIGLGNNVTDEVFRSGSKNLSDGQLCYGFSPSALVPWSASNGGASGNGYPDGYNLLDRGGLPIRDFGFPFDARYHATSSQTLKMNSYINKPFLVEKIVLETSASFTAGLNFWSNIGIKKTRTGQLGDLTYTPNQEFIPSHINTFFILNQRKNVSYTTYAAGCASGISTIPSTLALSNGAGQTHVNTGRDLITFLNIACCNASLNSSGAVTKINYNSHSWPEVGGPERYGTNIDLKIYDDNHYSDSGLVCSFGIVSEGTSRIVVSSSIKAVKFLPPQPMGALGSNDIVMSFLRAPQSPSNGTVLVTNSHNPYTFYFNTTLPDKLSYTTSGRNGLGIKLTNRDYLSPFHMVKYNVSKQYGYGYPGGDGTKQMIHPNYSILYFDSAVNDNPYLLMPEDELVFGWQIPSLVGSVENGASSADYYKITFKPGVSKVTLYGSYISNDQEYNDGTNQLLSSNSIHEVIGDD